MVLTIGNVGIGTTNPEGKRICTGEGSNGDCNLILHADSVIIEL